jgi:hypothetical protein
MRARHAKSPNSLEYIKMTILFNKRVESTFQLPRAMDFTYGVSLENSTLQKDGEPIKSTKIKIVKCRKK